MKKIGVIALVTLIVGFLPLFAQENDPTVTNLGDLLIRFCNDTEAAQEGGTKDLFLETVPGKEEDICIYLVNGGPTDIEVELGFVDGTITNDAEQKKACQPESTITQFGQYVTGSTKTLTIPAKSTTETHAKITFPQDTAGMVYGCATLKIVGGPQTNGAVQVISRRANFIDISVQGTLRPSLQIVQQETPVGWVLHNNDPLFRIISKPDTKELYGKVVVKNDGNIAQYVSIQPTTNRRGKSTSYDTVSKTILPQQENEFLFPVTDRPRWDGMLTINASITNSPVLESGTDLKTDGIDMGEKTQDLKANTLFMPRKLVFGALGLLLLLLLATGGKKKKHHDHDKKHHHKEEEEIIDDSEIAEYLQFKKLKEAAKTTRKKKSTE